MTGAKGFGQQPAAGSAGCGLGTVSDGIARHTPEGIAWRDMAMKEWFREAVRRRDAPRGDYGEGE